MDNYNSTVSLNSKENNRYQAIYASQSYGTFYGLFAKFVVKDVYSDTTLEPTTKLLERIDLKLINYKGILNICLKKSSNHEADTIINDKKTFILKIQVKGAISSDPDDTDSLVFDPPIKIKHNSYFIVLRELLTLNGQSGDEFNNADDMTPFVNGVFDSEFYERQGETIRKKSEIGFPIELDADDLKSNFADFYPGKICQTGISKINTY